LVGAGQLEHLKVPHTSSRSTLTTTCQARCGPKYGPILHSFRCTPVQEPHVVCETNGATHYQLGLQLVQLTQLVQLH
jgi:hypothetical protein